MICVLISLGCCIIAVVAGINFRSALTMDYNAPAAEDLPLVSVLVPVRNEEQSIGTCLDLLIRQTYPNLEIFVYDDLSEDRSADIIRHYAETFPQVLYCAGVPSLPGWTGKNWACEQLSRYARGEYLAFIDADVECGPDAISNAVTMIRHFRCQLLTCFPTQRMKTLGERCVVPLMHWFLLAFLPLFLVYRSRHAAWVAANGQFLVLDKKVYHELGGHRGVKDQVVEDMEIARAVKRHGYRCMTVLGGRTVFCRMYQKFLESFQGFSKNFFLGFNTTIPRFSIFLLGITLLFVFPLIAVWFDTSYLSAVLLILMARALVSIRSDQNIFWNLFLHPLQMLCMTAIGVYAVLRAKQGSIIWKGREVIMTRAKKSATTALFCCFFILCGSKGVLFAANHSIPPQEMEIRSHLRGQLERALQEEKAVDELLAYMRQHVSADPEEFPATLMAYYGTLQGLKAKFGVLPNRKLHHLQACLRYLDRAVQKDDADLETYFLRFSSLHHLPPFFGIPKKRYEDIQQICRLLGEKDYTLVDRHFQLMVVDFMLQSRRLKPQQLKDLKTLRTSLIPLQ